MSADPSNENVDYTNSSTWNRYSYVNGDPINFGSVAFLLRAGKYNIISIGVISLLGSIFSGFVAVQLLILLLSGR